MANFVLIFLCLFLGIVLRQVKVFPDSAGQVLNRFVIYISLPALTIRELHAIDIGLSDFPTIAMAWILFAFGIFFFYMVQRWQRFSRDTWGCLVLTGSLGNTSFVGFPLLIAIFGPSALSTGVLVDQPGTFLVAGTLGIVVASFFSARDFNLSVIGKKVLLFPPFMAVIISFATHSLVFPEFLGIVLEKLSATLVPLALVAVGVQLRFESTLLRKELKPLLWGLSFKLVLSPIMISAVYYYLKLADGELFKIIVAEAAMAPMITAGILAKEYDLNAELASLMIGIGIPLSLITVPLWVNFFNLIH